MKNGFGRLKSVVGVLALAGFLSLSGAAAPLVVATTSFVGDVVAQIGGDAVQLRVLFPVGADPHGFEPTPADAALLARAAVVFAVGAGLEEGLEPLLATVPVRVVRLAEFVPLLSWDGHDDDPGEGDPHVWLDPTLVAVWTLVIEDVLAELAPRQASAIAARASAYREALSELDRWISDEVRRIPEERRVLVSDHRVLGYFAHRYGFRVAGAVVPALSTLAEPSARELGELVATIRALGVRALFVATTVNPQLAQQVARDSGVRIVPLYTHSLSDPKGPAATYLDLMRYNVTAIVRALE